MSFKDLISRSFISLDEFKQEIAKLTSNQLNRGVLVESRAHGSSMHDERAIESSNDVNIHDLDSNEGTHLYNCIHKLSNNLYDMNAELAFQLHRDEGAGNKKTLLSGGHFWSIVSSVSHYHQQATLKPRPNHMWDNLLMPGLRTDSNRPDFFSEFTKKYNKVSGQIWSERPKCEVFVNNLKETFQSVHSSRLLIDSSTLVHCVLKSDPFLAKVQCLLRGLTTIRKIETFELDVKISKLRKLVDDHKVDLNLLLESNKNPEVVRDFYDILYLKLRSSNSIEVVCEFLRDFNLISLQNVCKGGIPYFQSEVLKEIGSTEHNQLSLPDFMKSPQNLGKDHTGNPNWLIWLTKVGEFARKCEEPSMKRFFAALVSDYSIVSEQALTPTEKLWNTLRVRNLSHPVLPQPRNHQEICARPQNHRRTQHGPILGS